MRPLATASIIYSLLLIGCAGLQLPDADICIADSARARMICQNLARDYQVVGNRVDLKPGAKPHYRVLARPSDVDRFTCADPQSWARIKAWAQALADKSSCQ